MTSTFPPAKIADIDAGWLNAWLASSGRAPGVQVVSVDRTDNPKWHVADTAFLSLSCEGDNADAVPQRLFAKLRTVPDPFAPHFPGEVTFYGWAGRCAKAGRRVPVPACHLSLNDRRAGTSLIFLDDLRASHDTLAWGEDPNNRQCLQAVRALAAIHATSWVQPATIDTAVVRAREELVHDYVCNKLPSFLDALDGHVAEDVADALADVCRAAHAHKVNRFTSTLPLCAAHGDAHAWNFLYPKDADVRLAAAIDFESWHVGFPGTDFAAYMALFWDADRRDRLQIGLLNAYFADLRARGATGYGWRDAWNDYRLGIACAASLALFQWDAGHDPSLWTATAKRWHSAFEDLNCTDVLT
ncbi:MAG: aminoglycoside phosphotransferase family protein [Alphaproteobacteria bacterium]